MSLCDTCTYSLRRAGINGSPATRECVHPWANEDQRRQWMTYAKAQRCPGFEHEPSFSAETH